MQVSKPSLPFQLRFDPIEARQGTLTPEVATPPSVSRVTTATPAEEAPRPTPAPSRPEVPPPRRQALYTQIARELADLQTQIASYGLLNGAGFAASPPTPQPPSIEPKPQSLHDVRGPFLAAHRSALEPVSASYDAKSLVSVQGADGNVEALHSLHAPGEPMPTRELRHLAFAVNDVVSLIEQSTGSEALDRDQVLQDLGAALAGLYMPSTDRGIRTLGDLGFSRENGDLSVDANRLRTLAAQSPRELDVFLGDFLTDRVAPLLTAGSQALQASHVPPAEVEAAAQSLRVRGEVAKLQARQQMLVLERQNYEAYSARMTHMSAALAQTAETIRRLTPSGQAAVIESAAVQAGRFAQPAPPAVPLIAPGAGLTSFGLGSGENASTPSRS